MECLGILYSDTGYVAKAWTFGDCMMSLLSQVKSILTLNINAKSGQFAGQGFTLKLLASINALVALPVCKPAMPDYDAISGQWPWRTGTTTDWNIWSQKYSCKVIYSVRFQMTDFYAGLHEALRSMGHVPSLASTWIHSLYRSITES